MVVVVGVAYMMTTPAKAPTGSNNPTATTTPTPQPIVWTTEKGNKDILRNISVKPGDTVSSPLAITGEARGNWYFEASFPIALVDWDGRIIAEVPAQAQGEWMTTEYVPFKATLTFTTPIPGDPAVNRGAIIIQKDNASGLPEHDDSLEIQIVYK